jgi:hypothetical protein
MNRVIARYPSFALRALGVALIGLGFGVGTCAALHGCVVHVRASRDTLASAGATLAALHAAHRRAYFDATELLRAQLARRGAPVGTYDRLVAPLDREFRARTEALAALDAALYHAAAVRDAARFRGGDRESLRAAARRVLGAMDTATATLARGDVLAPVPRPPELDAVATDLASLAGGDHDVRR